MTTVTGKPSSVRWAALQPAARRRVMLAPRFRPLVPPPARASRSRRALTAIAAAALSGQTAGAGSASSRWISISCGVRSRSGLSTPATARRRPTVPRRGSPLRLHNAWLKNRTAAVNLRNLISRGLDRGNVAWVLT